MSSNAIFACAGLGLLVIGLWALILHAHLMRKVLALNIMSSGIFLLLVGAGSRGAGTTDPVPQAMVITGIVVAISATALALSLVLRIANATGEPRLPRDGDGDALDEERAR